MTHVVEPPKHSLVRPGVAAALQPQVVAGAAVDAAVSLSGVRRVLVHAAMNRPRPTAWPGVVSAAAVAVAAADSHLVWRHSVASAPRTRRRACWVWRRVGDWPLHHSSCSPLPPGRLQPHPRPWRARCVLRGHLGSPHCRVRATAQLPRLARQQGHACYSHGQVWAWRQQLSAQ